MQIHIGQLPEQQLFICTNCMPTYSLWRRLVQTGCESKLATASATLINCQAGFGRSSQLVWEDVPFFFCVPLCPSEYCDNLPREKSALLSSGMSKWATIQTLKCQKIQGTDCSLKHCYSRLSIGTTWELIRNANSGAPHRPTESESLGIGLFKDSSTQKSVM